MNRPTSFARYGGYIFIEPDKIFGFRQLLASFVERRILGVMVCQKRLIRPSVFPSVDRHEHPHIVDRSVELRTKITMVTTENVNPRAGAVVHLSKSVDGIRFRSEPPENEDHREVQFAWKNRKNHPKGKRCIWTKTTVVLLLTFPGLLRTSMVSVSNLAVHVGGQALFEHVSFLIRPHDRIGLVGANGSGKTTLLRVLAGELPADEGSISSAHYVTIGYLPQENIALRGRTLYDEAATAFEDLISLQTRLDEGVNSLNSIAPDSDQHAELLEVIGELQHRLEDLDAYRMRSRIEKVLMGLGFTVNDLSRKSEEFSGGWQMRIALAKLLLQTPSVLLLDEPTNHLDIESLAWLEDYLASYDGAVIVVSHDTVFLDRATVRTLGLSRRTLDDHRGNYSSYVSMLDERNEQLGRERKKQQDRIRDTERFIERFRYKASKARQVQSRIKQLDRLERIEDVEGQEEIAFSFPEPPSSGKVVMSLKEIVKSYGSAEVFRGISLTVGNGDRIAVVGVNGAGKSTLLRIMAGIEPFESGDRIPGYNLTLSYFAQHQADDLDPNQEVLEIVDDVAQGEIRKKLRSILGSFLFHGDDVFKKVKVLSGGEKSRLALARMLLRPSNLLLLDEPTNHLDIRSKAILQEALLAYTGSFVIVSHDRGFLDPIVNTVLEVSASGVRTFFSTVSEYVEMRRKEQAKAWSGKAASASEAVRPDKYERRRLAGLRQEKSRLLHPLMTELREKEREIDKLEREIRALERAMIEPDAYKRSDELKRTGKEVKKGKLRLTMLLQEWENLGKHIQSIESEFIEKLKKTES